MAERPDYPTDRDILDARFEQHALETWTAFPGRVQGYDPDTQTADIVPLLRVQVPQADGSYIYENPPVVPSVAIIQPRAGGFFLSLPVQDGDTVMCVVCDGDIGTWSHGSGDVTSPRDLRRHHLSHTVAFVGLSTFNQPLRHVSATDLVMGSDDDNGLRVFVSPNGAFNILRGNDPVMHIDPGAPSSPPSYVALAPLVDAIVSSLKTAIANWTPVPNDGGASLKAVIAAWSPASVTATKLKAT